jgi:hypothetical protein
VDGGVMEKSNISIIAAGVRRIRHPISVLVSLDNMPRSTRVILNLETYFSIL